MCKNILNGNYTHEQYLVPIGSVLLSKTKSETYKFYADTWKTK